MTPRNMPPKDRFVEGRGFPDGTSVNAIVEEHDENAPPVPSNRDQPVPAAWPLHLVRRKVESVDFRLGQVVSARHVALLPRLREPRWRVDKFLVPGPRNDGAQVFASLVRSAAGIQPFVRDGALVDPIQKLADVLPPQFL